MSKKKHNSQNSKVNIQVHTSEDIVSKENANVVTLVPDKPNNNVDTLEDNKILVVEELSDNDDISTAEKISDNSENIENVSAISEVSKDINDISDATQEALKDVDKVAYGDNLKERTSSSKSIRDLNLQDSSDNNAKSTETENRSLDITKNDAQDASTYTAVKTKSKKTLIISIICILILAIILGVLSTIFALLNSFDTKIISGISIYGIDVSGLLETEATDKVKAIIDERLAKEITLKHNEYESKVFAEQFEVSLDIDAAVKTAYSKGRNGNIFVNNFEIISSYFNHTNIVPSITYSDETFNSLITEMNDNLPDRVVNANYYIDGNNLIITNGIDGVQISSEDLKADIIYYINNITCTESTIDIPVVQITATEANLDTIYSEIHKDAVDAYYTTSPYVVYPEVYGVDFAISIDEAKALLAESTETCTIPLKVLNPGKTTSDIGTEAFPDLLASFSTTYSTRNTNRSTNIALASSKINGIVIMPGETFSYNETVGKRTTAAGFKSAAVYSNGEVTTGIGGGICQVSSTLYNAVLLANLGIVDRTNHGFNPGYVQAGRDATVSWGSPDFKFKNTRTYPVKIVCSGTGGKINFQIFGLKSDDEYEVVIQASTVSTIAYKTIYQNTTSLAKGQTKVSQSGSNGCKTVTYRILKKNGVEVSRELLSKDTYNPHNKIVLVGV